MLTLLILSSLSLCRVPLLSPQSNGKSRRHSARQTPSLTLRLLNPKSPLPWRPAPANTCPGTSVTAEQKHARCKCFFFLSWLRRTSCNTTAVPGSVILTLEKTSLTLSRCSYRFSALLPWWPPVFPARLDRTRQRWEIRLVVVHDWITQLFAIKWKWPWPPLSPPYPAASATGSECHFTSLSAHCQKSFLVIFGHPKYDQQP